LFLVLEELLHKERSGFLSGGAARWYVFVFVFVFSFRYRDERRKRNQVACRPLATIAAAATDIQAAGA